jgi:beta-1,4-N-acetylglucosaminyltransferase
MILVTVGSSTIPFDRLVRAVDGLEADEPVIVQRGPSAVRPAAARVVDFLPMHELTELVREARVVITHGGVGTILLALTNGTRPYVVPRSRAHGEGVDDHQLESARRFAAAGLITLVEDPADLPVALAGGGSSEFTAPDGEPALVTELREYVTEALA